MQREYNEMEEKSETLLTQTASHPLLLQEQEAKEMVSHPLLLQEEKAEAEDEMVVLEKQADEAPVSVSTCLKHEKIYASSQQDAEETLLWTRLLFHDFQINLNTR